MTGKPSLFICLLMTALVLSACSAPASSNSTATSTASQAAPATKMPTATNLPSPSPSPTPVPVSEDSFAVGFLADGSLLVFNSSVDDLVPEDQNHVMDPFVYHTADGSIDRIVAP